MSSVDAPEPPPSAGAGKPSVLPLSALPLLAGHEHRSRQGHPWVYNNELNVTAAHQALPPGALVRLAAPDGADMGVGFYNPHTLIALRRLTTAPGSDLGRRWLNQRLHQALMLRQRLCPLPYYRLIHAEADGLPGLIIDRYGPVLVLQANCAGMDRLLPDILDACAAVLAPTAIIARNDSGARAQEGLPQDEPCLVRGTWDGPVVVEENGARFPVDPLTGQKTGWFFDQRDNRAFVARLAAGARVLDLFAYQGGLGVAAAVAGAVQVTAIDRSEGALVAAAAAAELSGVADRVQVRRADAFAELERMAAAGERFDIVSADPPAFVKSRRDLGAGSRGYRKLARMTARITAHSGFLALSSCSHNVDPDTFFNLCVRGLTDAGRSGRLLHRAGAAPDHPIHPLLPESAYLKFLVFQLD